jgi:aspartate aminotransferase
MNLSKRSVDLPQSPIRKLVPFAMDAKKRGIKVYHLNIGDPDIKTPEVMISALKNWDRKIIGYENSQGNAELLTSLESYYQKLGFNDLTQKNIQVTVGGSEGLLWTMMTVCNPGDEIIVFEPFYANYNGFAIQAGVKLVPVTTRIEEGFHILPKKNADRPGGLSLQKYVTGRTKAVLICNPNNPTGTLYSKEELQFLYDFCQKNKLWLISDEVYREFVYDGWKQTSVLEIEQLNDRTMELSNNRTVGKKMQSSTVQQFNSSNVVVCDSLSKRYSLCGARLGCLVSRNMDFMNTVLKFAQARLSAPLIEQVISSKLTEVGEKYLREVNQEYQARRDLVCEKLAEISQVVFRKPEGAFYIIAKLPVDNAEKFCQWLLTDFNDKNETLMLAPAAGFYATQGLGVQEVRIAYVINQRDLSRSMDLLKIAIERYIKV